MIGFCLALNFHKQVAIVIIIIYYIILYLFTIVEQGILQLVSRILKGKTTLTKAFIILDNIGNLIH